MNVCIFGWKGIDSKFVKVNVIFTQNTYSNLTNKFENSK
jgi:hypothetical protein